MPIYAFHAYINHLLENAINHVHTAAQIHARLVQAMAIVAQSHIRATGRQLLDYLPLEVHVRLASGKVHGASRIVDAQPPFEIRLREHGGRVTVEYLQHCVQFAQAIYTI